MVRKILFTATGSLSDSGFDKIQIDNVPYKNFMRERGIEVFDGYVESCHGCPDLMRQYSRDLQGIVEGGDRVVGGLNGGLLFGLPSLQATQTTFPIISVPLDYVAYTAFAVPSGHATIAGVGVERIVEGDETGTLQRAKALKLAERILNLNSDKVNVLTRYPKNDEEIRKKLNSFGIQISTKFDPDSLSLVYGYNEYDSWLKQFKDQVFIWAEPNFSAGNWDSMRASEAKHHTLLYNSAPNAQVYGANNLAIFGAKIISLQRADVRDELKEIAEKKRASYPQHSVSHRFQGAS